jgi:MipA family protein
MAGKCMSGFKPFTTSLACAALGLLAPAAGFAQAFDTVRLYGAAPGQDGGTTGAALVAGTEYRGSDQRRTLLVPVLDYQWANGWFAGVTNGVGVNLASNPQWQYGLRVVLDLGRSESRSKALRGMGDIDTKAEASAFANYATAAGMFLSSSVRYGSGNDGKGLVVDLGAGHGSMLAPQWRLGLGVGLTLANAEHMQAYFGVTPTQARNSGYRAYNAGAGVRDVRANVALTHLFNRRLSATLALSASGLQGDAKDSPLTRQASTVSGVLGLGYAF